MGISPDWIGYSSVIFAMDSLFPVFKLEMEGLRSWTSSPFLDGFFLFDGIKYLFIHDS